MDEDLKRLICSCNGFEWDKGNKNKSKSKEKHSLTTEEYEQVFFNRPLLADVDYKHSNKEPRFFVLGKTNLERKLFIVFTIRNNKIRIIFARGMNEEERKIYYKELSNEKNT